MTNSRDIISGEECLTRLRRCGDTLKETKYRKEDMLLELVGQLLAG